MKPNEFRALNHRINPLSSLSLLLCSLICTKSEPSKGNCDPRATHCHRQSGYAHYWLGCVYRLMLDSKSSSPPSNVSPLVSRVFALAFSFYSTTNYGPALQLASELADDYGLPALLSISEEKKEIASSPEWFFLKESLLPQFGQLIKNANAGVAPDTETGIILCALVPISVGSILLAM